MRELSQCKEEVFRRSRERIEKRKRGRRRILALGLPLCLLVVSLSLYLPSLPALRDTNSSGGASTGLNGDGDVLGNGDGDVPGNGDREGEGTKAPDSGDADLRSLDGFSFSLTWGCYGVSSYDSVSGRLVKTTDATHPEEFVTVYRLTDAQKEEIYHWIEDLDLSAYPDSYNPQGPGISSNPSMTLILSVKTDSMEKTVRAEEIALSFQSKNKAGQKFLDVCKAIRDLLTETDAWRALPDYEFYYD